MTVRLCRSHFSRLSFLARSLARSIDRSRSRGIARRPLQVETESTVDGEQTTFEFGESGAGGMGTDESCGEEDAL